MNGIENEPFVNLRLLKQRNLWAGSLVTFGMGFALFSSVYLLPLYLQSVQGYNAYQTGLTMLWIGLPQLLIFPVVPLLMKKVDLRVLVCFRGARLRLELFHEHRDVAGFMPARSSSGRTLFAR